MSPCAIVIPIYKTTLSVFERMSMDQCFEVFQGEQIIVIKPSTLDISSLASCYNFAKVEDFSQNFFSGISGYNRLMTSEEFYGRFLDYNYILIYQLDAFVFQNQLDYWCSLNYDYIGAPWLWDLGPKNFLRRLKHRLVTSFHIYFNTINKSTGVPVDKQFRDKVGNGGFSLRNVSRFYNIVKDNKALIDFYNSNQDRHHYFNEDAFWSIEVNRRAKRLRIPTYKVAARFSFENGLNKAIKLTNGQLPFGCHDWDNNLEFWRPYFKEFGYTI